jgi:hypothetical protein
VRVRSRPLVLSDGLLELGAEQEQTTAWSVDGRSLLPSAGSTGSAPPVSVGDQVAMHWDWVCDVLSPEQLARLDWHTVDQLARTNAGLRAATG